MALRDLLGRKPKTTQPPRTPSGRGHTSGYLQLDELNQELAGKRGLRIFEEMARTDPDVRRNVLMATSPIIAGAWAADPFGGDDADEQSHQVADDVAWALGLTDDSPFVSWADHLAEVAPLVVEQGFAPVEVCWATATRDGRTLLVPRVFSVKLPRTIEKWHQDAYGELTSIEQFVATRPESTVPGQAGSPGSRAWALIAGRGKNAPAAAGQAAPTGYIVLPAEDLLYYRVGARGDNWEGTPLLRACYKPWYIKDKVEKIDALGQEREAQGLPIVYPPAGHTAGDPVLDQLEQHLAELGMGDRPYLIMPGPSAEDVGESGWRLTIEGMGGAGAKRDAQSTLQYHRDALAATFALEFMRLGQGGEGSKGALSSAEVQDDPVQTVMASFAGIFSREANRKLVARFVALNYGPDTPCPTIRMTEADEASLDVFTTALTGLVTAGVLHADDELEDSLRQRLKLPPADPAAREQRKQLEDRQAEAAATSAELGAQAPPAPPAGEKVTTTKHTSGGGPDTPATREKVVEERRTLDDGGHLELARADRPLAPHEALMQLDAIEGSLNAARARFQQTAGSHVTALAAHVATHPSDPMPPPPEALTRALTGDLQELRALGYATVERELADQHAGAAHAAPSYGPGESIGAVRLDSTAGDDGLLNHGGHNWVHRVGGLPGRGSTSHQTIHHLAADLIRDGHPESQAIAIAVSQAKKNCASGHAGWCHTAASWEAKKARAHTLAAEDGTGITARAGLAAQAIVHRIWQAVTGRLLAGDDQADAQAAGEQAGAAAARAAAVGHAGAALGQGRQEAADDHADEIAGARYTSILDGNRCDRCALADDGVLRTLTDPVRVARKPPNRDCEGGDACRCMEFFQLKDEAPAMLADDVVALDFDPHEPRDHDGKWSRKPFPGLDSLKVTGALGGTTGPQLAEDGHGSRYVVKDADPAKAASYASPNAGHLRSEMLTDELYNAMGVRVPESQNIGTDGKPVRASRFVEGGTVLGQLAPGDPRREQLMAQLRDHFAVDAWLGAWDVIGAGSEFPQGNVMIDKHGRDWRIDTGGSLRYKGMGELKPDGQFGPEVSELKRMRKSSSGGPVFGSLTDEQVAEQIRALFTRERVDAALALVDDPDLRRLLLERAKYMKRWAADVLGTHTLDDDDDDWVYVLADWTPQEHPRDDHGRFRVKIGGIAHKVLSDHFAASGLTGMHDLLNPDTGGNVTVHENAKGQKTYHVHVEADQAESLHTLINAAVEQHKVHNSHQHTGSAKGGLERARTEAAKAVEAAHYNVNDDGAYNAHKQHLPQPAQPAQATGWKDNGPSGLGIPMGDLAVGAHVKDDGGVEYEVTHQMTGSEFTDLQIVHDPAGQHPHGAVAVFPKTHVAPWVAPKAQVTGPAPKGKGKGKKPPKPKGPPPLVENTKGLTMGDLAVGDVYATPSGKHVKVTSQEGSQTAGELVHDPSGAIPAGSPISIVKSQVPPKVASHATKPKPPPAPASTTPFADTLPTGQKARNRVKAQQADEVTSDEASAFASYVGSGYGSINEALRGKGVHGEDVHGQVEAMDGVYDRGEGLSEPILLHRGIKSHSATAKLWLEQAQEGSIVVDNGYQSTSTSEEFATNWASGGVLLRIRVPAGVKPLSLLDVKYPGQGGHVGLGGESEVLLPHGLRMKVIKKRTLGGVTVFEVVLVGIPNSGDVDKA